MIPKFGFGQALQGVYWITFVPVIPWGNSPQDAVQTASPCHLPELLRQIQSSPTTARTWNNWLTASRDTNFTTGECNLVLLSESNSPGPNLRRCQSQQEFVSASASPQRVLGCHSGNTSQICNDVLLRI